MFPKIVNDISLKVKNLIKLQMDKYKENDAQAHHRKLLKRKDKVKTVKQ